MARRSATTRRVEELVVDVLAGAAVAAVAVDTGRGVHVSPQAFAWAAGRAWLLTPSDSLKARSIRRRAVAGVTVQHGDKAVVVTGRAQVLDAWPPAAALAALPSAPRLGLGALAYGRRNGAVAVGVALDALAGRMGLPSARSVVCVEPAAWAFVDGVELLAASGWEPAEPVRAGRPRRATVDLTPLPARQRTLVIGATQGDVGWSTAAGPAAVPAAAVDLTEGRVTVVAALADRLGAPAGEGCVMVHASPGSRPGRYRGVLLRGPLLTGARQEGRLAVTVRPRRLTWWEGYRSTTAETATATAAAAPAAAGRTGGSR